MAEGRMLKKRISKSHKFATLKTNNARLLYLMIYPHLDIKGRIDADSTLIKGEITPLLNFSRQKIQEYLEDMHNVGLIKLYQSNDQWYLEMTKFADFQILRTDHEGKSQCPNPTTDQLRELDGRATAQVKESKVKLSKVNISKDSKAGKPVLSKITKDLLDKVYKQGFNIYALLGRFKKKSKVDLPEAVIEKVCNSYLKNHEKIQNDWAWFMVAVAKASREYFAEQSIKEGEAWKKQPVALSIKEIMRKAGG